MRVFTNWHLQKTRLNLAEIGMQKKSISMRKLKLLKSIREDECRKLCEFAFYAVIAKGKPFADKQR